jgi:glutamine synthetase-like protein
MVPPGRRWRIYGLRCEAPQISPLASVIRHRRAAGIRQAQPNARESNAAVSGCPPEGVPTPFASSDDLVDYIQSEEVAYVDVRFCDVPGVMQHFSVPAASFDAEFVQQGVAFDGSSIRGFQSIHEADMLLLPDVSTAQLDPFRAAKTLNVNCFVHDPFTCQAYSRDPRNVARKAEEFIRSSGIADTAYFGPEAVDRFTKSRASEWLTV